MRISALLPLALLAPAAAAQTSIALIRDNDEWAHTDRAGSAITLDKLRGEASLGAVLAHGVMRMTFVFTEESKCYDQQRQPQRFGEVSLSWSF